MYKQRFTCYQQYEGVGILHLIGKLSFQYIYIYIYFKDFTIAKYILDLKQIKYPQFSISNVRLYKIENTLSRVFDC